MNTYQFKLGVEPGYGSRQVELTVTVRDSAGKTYADIVPITIIEGWAAQSKSTMADGTFVTNIKPRDLSLDIACAETKKTLYTYCGIYDASGRLLDIGVQQFEAALDENENWPVMQTVSFPDLTIPESCAYWRVFLLDGKLQSYADIKVLLPEVASETTP